ncbi:hypothetical protein ACFL5A_00040 [Gemmatimonadota bacterium]
MVEGTLAALEAAGYHTFLDIIDLEKNDFLRVPDLSEPEADRLLGIIDELTVVEGEVDAEAPPAEDGSGVGDEGPPAEEVSEDDADASPVEGVSDVDEEMTAEVEEGGEAEEEEGEASETGEVNGEEPTS